MDGQSGYSIRIKEEYGRKTTLFGRFGTREDNYNLNARENKWERGGNLSTSVLISPASVSYSIAFFHRFPLVFSLVCFAQDKMKPSHFRNIIVSGVEDRFAAVYIKIVQKVD